MNADPVVLEWRKPVVSAIKIIVGINDIGEMVVDFLIPTFVKLPPLSTSGDNIMTFPGNDDCILFKVVELAKLPPYIPIVRGFYGSPLPRIELVLVAQPFVLSTLVFHTQHDWGIDRCTLSPDTVKKGKLEKRVNLDKRIAKELLNSRKPDSLYQTRIVIFRRHAQDCRDGCCEAPSSMWNSTWIKPLSSIQLPIPPSPIPNNYLFNPKWSFGQA
jgi:hypothetical protein